MLKKTRGPFNRGQKVFIGKLSAVGTIVGFLGGGMVKLVVKGEIQYSSYKDLSLV